MISIPLGQRYERLLFATAPISLAAIVVCLVAFASVNQKERVTAKCYLKAAELFESRSPSLKEEWSETKKKDEFWYINYRSALTSAWIDDAVIDACYDTVKQEIDASLYKKSPDEIAADLKFRAESLNKAPLTAYGIVIPKEASVNLFVTDIKIDFLLMSRILQAVLLPVLLLWLGSLYATRYRESLLISKAESMALIFPHIINMYPAFDMPSLRKHNPIAPYLKPIACLYYAILRVGLLSIFLAPPVAAYLYSLYLSGLESVSYLYIAAGIVVFMFFLTTLLAEFLPMHYRKIFPDPTK